MNKILYKYLPLLLVTALLIFGCAPSYDQGVVCEIRGSWLKMEDDTVLRLAGITIPQKDEPNYYEELELKLDALLSGNEIRYKTVLMPHKSYKTYPEVPHVEVYLEGVNLNEQLVKTGYAFFSHDPGWEFRKYLKLQEMAHDNSLGVWGFDRKPGVIVEAKKSWDSIHFTNCPEMKNVNEREKIKYYVYPPFGSCARIFRTKDKFCKVKKYEEEFSFRENPFPCNGLR